MLRRMCKHSPCRIGYCDRRDRKKLVLGNRAKCPAPAPMRNARRHPRHAAVAGATKENSSTDSSPGGVRETAAQCFESGGDFNPISAEQLRQLGLGLFNEGAQGVPVDAQKNPQGFAVLGLKVRKIRSVSPTNVRSAAASGFMANAIYTTS